MENSDKEANQAYLDLQSYENILHDVKTQIFLIYGAWQLMDLYGELNHFAQNQPKSYNTLAQGIKRAAKMLSDSEDARKIMSENYAVRWIEYDILDIIKELVAETEAIAQPKEIKLSVQANVETMPMYIDKAILERILLNLLSNAVKYTRSDGEVIVRLERKEESVSIVVEDSGEGIDEDKLQLIFERYKVFNTNSGTGIGLSIVKGLAELMKGTVSAKNNVGKKGASMIVNLPILEKEVYQTDPKLNCSNTLSRKDLIQIELSDGI